MPRKLLLTSVCKPFGPQHGDATFVSAEGGYQLMWAQGVFRSDGTSTQWGIELIAANLEILTTTLHYPAMRRLEAELRRGYDFVGIAFVASAKHKMIPMVQAVRRIAPETEIILPASIDHAPSAPRPWLRQLLQCLERETGPLTSTERVLALAVRPMTHFTKLRHRYALWEQPPTTSRSWRQQPAAT